jgi:CMP-N-acetylneuraminic acid synthetase
MDKVVAIVPLKERSQRFPGKNLVILDGKPLYELILETLTLVEEIEEIYIYSSASIFKVPLRNNMDKILFKFRPEYLDGDSISINTVLREFLHTVEAKTIVLAHSTSPFLTPQTISKCLRKVISGENDSALAVVELKKFAVFEGRALNFDREQDLPPLQTIEPVIIEQGGLYIFEKLDFLKKNRRVGSNPHFQFVDSREALDIDTPEDYSLAKAYLLS